MGKPYKIILEIETSREYGRKIVQGISKYSNLKGPWIFYTKLPFYRKRDAKEESLLRPENWDADGIIPNINFSTKHRINKIIQSKLPTVFVGEYIPGYPTVTGDYFKIGVKGARYLLSLNFKNFGFCTFKKPEETPGELIDGFNSIINAAGYKTSYFLLPKLKPTYSWLESQKQLAKWLKSLPKPVAIMACNDDCGFLVTEACKIGKIKIPDEVIVLGVDNDLVVCNLSNPPLTSIALNLENAGFLAAKLLGKMIKEKKIIEKRIMILPTNIVPRESTKI